MSEDFRNLDLMETGTRLEHYNELREVFMVGVEMLKGMHPGHKNDADIAQQTRLEIAAEVITARIDILSEFAKGCGYGKYLQLTVDTIARNLSLMEGKDEHDSGSQGEGTETNPQA